MELPVFREFDFRLMLGANIAFRLASQQVGDYSEAYVQQEGSFMYKPGSFTWFDMGYIFGLSMEYREFLFRLRTVSGLARLDRQDQGMINSVQFEIGYFLFRRTGKKPVNREKSSLPDLD